MQLNIPDDIAAEIQREAEIRNLPPEEVAMGVLRSRFRTNGTANGQQELAVEVDELPSAGDEDTKPKNLAEALGDFIGAVSSKDRFPEGSTMSRDTGRRFTDMLAEDRKRKIEDRRRNSS